MVNIDIDHNSITLDDSAEAKKAQSGFCDAWPSAKTGLKMLRSIVKNPIAKGAISIVIAAGDAVATSICSPAGA